MREEDADTAVLPGDDDGEQCEGPGVPADHRQCGREDGGGGQCREQGEAGLRQLVRGSHGGPRGEWSGQTEY